LAAALIVQGAFLGAVALDAGPSFLQSPLEAITNLFAEDSGEAKFESGHHEVMGAMVTF
jgi:hypothetical protein